MIHLLWWGRKEGGDKYVAVTAVVGCSTVGVHPKARTGVDEISSSRSGDGTGDASRITIAGVTADGTTSGLNEESLNESSDGDHSDESV